MNSSEVWKILRCSTLKAPGRGVRGQGVAPLQDVDLSKSNTTKLSEEKRSSFPSNGGYTLIEVLVVVILIGVIAAIAAPSWLTFVAQRRVGEANDLVYRALQDAQGQAKKKKVHYSVSFIVQSDDTKIAVYPTRNPNVTNSDGSYAYVDLTKDATFVTWKSFNQELGIKPGQVLLGTNLAGENTIQTNISYPGNTAGKITFDQLGVLDPAPSTTPLTITVAMPSGSSTTTPVPQTVRCVQIRTLLGSITTARGSACGS
jgi:prepilin-type N-terminal cleavage/methylation domain-containing protein